MKTLKILLTIHAVSEWNERGQCQGHCDSVLSEAGRRMAALLAGRHDLHDIKAIYTSDLKRASQTATPLSEKIGVPVQTSQSLREGNWAEYHHDPDYPPLPFDGPFEDGVALAKRAVRSMLNIAESESRSPILIVAHGGFVRSFLAQVFSRSHPRIPGCSYRDQSFGVQRWEMEPVGPE